MVRRMDHGLGPIVDDGTERTAGRNAQRVNLSAGQALADVVRTTLGPKGLDKMIISAEGKVVVTNNGARVLDLIDIEQPAAETLAEIAADQAEQVGDGTTTAVILAGELLTQAEALLEEGVHPTTITSGYRFAAERVVALLTSYALEVDPDDVDALEKTAATVVTGKWDRESVSFLASLAAETVLTVERNATIDLKRITRRTVPGGRLHDSEIVDGLVIDTDRSSTSIVTPSTEAPRRIEGAAIALIDGGLTIEGADEFGSISLDGPEERRQLIEYENGVYAEQVERITATGADIVFCQQAIDDAVQYLLAKRNVLAVERTRRDELIQLGRATGATHVGSIDELTTADIGNAGLIEQRIVGGQELTVVSESENTEQISLLLRGGPEHVVNELRRIVDGCLDVLKTVIEQQAVVPGGGSCEIRLARDLRSNTDPVNGREQLAVDAFANALEAVPRTLAVTAGLNPIDVLMQLRHRHHNGDTTVGLDLTTGAVSDVVDAGVLEPLAVKQRSVSGAEEAANMLIRVDDVIVASRDQSETHHEHDHDSGPGGLQSTEGYPWAIGH
jgi:archaeal chaperonin